MRECDYIFLNKEIDKYYKSLMKYVYTITRNIYVTEDIVQQTFLTSTEKIDLIRNYDSLMPIFKKIAKNIFCDKYRKEIKIAKALKILDGETIKVEKDVLNTVLEKAKNKEILTAINKLKPKYAQVIRLHYIYEEPLTEVSRLMNLNYNTTVSINRRALKQLKLILDPNRKTPVKNKHNKTNYLFLILFNEIINISFEYKNLSKIQ
ncbi:RNA polymerase sigma factor [Anaerovorax odorimutans]|uniref:RNA polymerase sigma factor n=1 Tax=Anaerovorax odorimutans TaxID=109327 RepID=UPI0004215895|nr:RNA polymerase sigma factor [Anaerovorax odorimutans]